MRPRVPPTIAAALRRRGIAIRASDGDDEMLVESWSPGDAALFFAEMQRYSFRLMLKDVVRLGGRGDPFSAEQLTRHASLETVGRHLDQLVRLALVARLGQERFRCCFRINSLGPTLEWLVAEVLRRELGFTVARSVPLRGGATGGDLDVVAMAEGQLIYVEVKSGPPKHISLSQIGAFLDRVDALAPSGAIFLEDTELRMADKVVVLFQEVLAQRRIPWRPERLQREIYGVGPGIVIANAHPEIAGNLTYCVKHLWRRRGLQLTVDVDP